MFAIREEAISSRSSLIIGHSIGTRGAEFGAEMFAIREEAISSRSSLIIGHSIGTRGVKAEGKRDLDLRHRGTGSFPSRLGVNSGSRGLDSMDSGP